MDNREISEWLTAIGSAGPGDFLCALSEVVLKADDEDYSIIRPALMNLKRKYMSGRTDPETRPDVHRSQWGSSRRAPTTM